MILVIIAQIITYVKCQKLVMDQFPLDFFRGRECDEIAAGGWLVAAKCGPPENRKLIVQDVASLTEGEREPYVISQTRFNSLSDIQLQPVSFL